MGWTGGNKAPSEHSPASLRSHRALRLFGALLPSSWLLLGACRGSCGEFGPLQ